MDAVNYKELQAQRDLQACGLTQESINAIRATTVVNHNGAQHVVAHSDVGKFEHAQQQLQTSIQVEDATGAIPQQIINSLQQQFVDQQRMFSRFKQFSDQRITSLERQVAQYAETIKDLTSKVNTLVSNQQARAVQSQTSQAVAGVAQKETVTKAPSTQPIDRNGVSPDSVSIDKMFYCGER